MNCEQARSLLPQDRYGELTAPQHEELAKHLAQCPACAEVARSLDGVRHLLDSAPSLAVHVDLAEIYRRSAELERQRGRKWRRFAWTTAAAAAILFLLLGLRVELRWHERELVVGWGIAPARPPTRVIEQPPELPPSLQADLDFTRELVHAVAADVEQRDQGRLERLRELDKRLDDMAATWNRRWNTTQNQLRALYTAYHAVRDQGDLP